MCKTVYLISKRFDKRSRRFSAALAEELERRSTVVTEGHSCDIFNFLKKHKTYGISIAFDFYKDGKRGHGLTLNKRCSSIGRDFAYNLSSNLDSVSPSMNWREFNFVRSSDKKWNKFFSKTSSKIKITFHICATNNVDEYEMYLVLFDKIVKAFAAEIIRCMRSDYDVVEYRKRVKLAKLITRKKQNGCL